MSVPHNVTDEEFAESFVNLYIPYSWAHILRRCLRNEMTTQAFAYSENDKAQLARIMEELNLHLKDLV
jgi:hypothetical protein